MAQCIETTKAGTRCKHHALEGKRKCIQHDKSELKSRAGKQGGRPRKPLDELSESYRRTLKYYRPVFTKTAYKRFEEIIGDPELYSIRGNAAIAEMFMLDALKIVWDGDKSYAEWGKALKMYRAMNEAILGKDDTNAKFANEQLGKILVGGVTSENAKRDVVALGEHKARLIQSEIKRYVALEGTFTARDVADLLEHVAECAKRVFSDAAEVERFVKEIGHEGAGGVVAGALGARRESA